jgi:hypothetical protein
MSMSMAACGQYQRMPTTSSHALFRRPRVLRQQRPHKSWLDSAKRPPEHSQSCYVHGKGVGCCCLHGRACRCSCSGGDREAVGVALDLTVIGALVGIALNILGGVVLVLNVLTAVDWILSFIGIGPSTDLGRLGIFISVNNFLTMGMFHDNCVDGITDPDVIYDSKHLVTDMRLNVGDVVMFWLGFTGTNGIDGLSALWSIMQTYDFDLDGNSPLLFIINNGNIPPLDFQQKLIPTNLAGATAKFGTAITSNGLCEWAIEWDPRIHVDIPTEAERLESVSTNRQSGQQQHDLWRIAHVFIIKLHTGDQGSQIQQWCWHHLYLPTDDHIGLLVPGGPDFTHGRSTLWRERRHQFRWGGHSRRRSGRQKRPRFAVDLLRQSASLHAHLMEPNDRSRFVRRRHFRQLVCFRH